MRSELSVKPKGWSDGTSGAGRVGGVAQDLQQGIALGVGGGALALHQEAAAHRVLVEDLPGAVALHAGGEARPLGPRRDAVERQVAELIGLVGQLGIAGEARELEVDILVTLLQRSDGEIALLPLALVENRAVEVRLAVDGEVCRLVGRVGNLEGRARPAGDEGQPRVVVDDAGDLGQPVPLVGVVVDRRERRGRILDAEAVVDVLAGREVVDRAGAAAVREGGLRVVARAAGDGDFGAGIGRARLHGDVDDARGMQAVLRGQGARQQRHLVGVARRQDVVEQRQALGQLHAVEPVLDVAVIAAHVDLAEAVLDDAGRAQQHLVQGRALAQRDVADGALAEVVGRGAEAGLDGAARLVEPRRRDGDAERRIGDRRRGCRRRLRGGGRRERRWCRWRRLRGGRRCRRDQARDQRQTADMPPHDFPHGPISQETL